MRRSTLAIIVAAFAASIFLSSCGLPDPYPDKSPLQLCASEMVSPGVGVPYKRWFDLEGKRYKTLDDCQHNRNGFKWVSTHTGPNVILASAVTTQSASGDFLVQFGCHHWPEINSDDFNLTSNNEAQNAFGVAWSVRMATGHIRGNSGACGTPNEKQGPFAVPAMRERITFERQFFGGWVTCGVLDTNIVKNVATLDKHLDSFTTPCNQFNFPAGFSKVTVEAWSQDTTFVPTDYWAHAYLV